MRINEVEATCILRNAILKPKIDQISGSLHQKIQNDIEEQENKSHRLAVIHKSGNIYLPLFTLFFIVDFLFF